MTRTIVTITECYGAKTTTVTTHNTPNADQAIRRAVTNRYGKSRGFYEEPGSGRHHRYGRVGHGVPRKHGGGITMETGTVYIAVQQEAN